MKSTKSSSKQEWFYFFFKIFMSFFSCHTLGSIICRLCSEIKVMRENHLALFLILKGHHSSSSLLRIQIFCKLQRESGGGGALYQVEVTSSQFLTSSLNRYWILLNYFCCQLMWFCCCCLIAKSCHTIYGSVDCNPPASLGQRYWSGLPFPSLKRDLPYPRRLEPVSLH